MARLNWRSAVGEYHRSLSTRAFLRDLRKLVPALEAGGLEPGGAGVRAQSLDREGRLVDDFVFAESSRMMHVLNVPSPAATASLAIARSIADRVATRIANTTTCAVVAQPMSSPA
jgi:L-2-hydroxyglutarate oxidase